MKTKIKVIILLAIVVSVLAVAKSVSADAIGYFEAPETVYVGDSFDVRLWLNTTDGNRGFTLRQLLFDTNIELTNISFGDVWVDTPFNDTGHLNKSQGNLTYAMVGYLDKYIKGNHTALVLTFTALSEGQSNISIPKTIWSGQPGFQLVDLDNVSWHNTSINVVNYDDITEPPEDPPKEEPTHRRRGKLGGGGTIPPSPLPLPLKEPIVNEPNVTQTNDTQELIELVIVDDINSKPIEPLIETTDKPDDGNPLILFILFITSFVGIICTKQRKY